MRQSRRLDRQRVAAVVEDGGGADVAGTGRFCGGWSLAIMRFLRAAGAAAVADPACSELSEGSLGGEAALARRR